MATVLLKNGKIEGFEDNDNYVYLGVPYAKAPVGELRFREPKELEPWEGVLSTKEYKRDPMQRYGGNSPEAYSEDCLYLNIWVPKTEEKNLPVMVWIPGGAYATGGSGALKPEGPSLYEGGLMAKEMNAIVVTVSYRLNVFGFLNMSILNKRFEDNLGLKDAVMAIKWVSENIGAFGGDKDNVTLFGESAGAGVISTLLMMPSAQPYFHKTIMQSNCFGSYYTEEEERDVVYKYFEMLGNAIPSGKLSDEEVEEFLNLDYNTLLDAADNLTKYVLTKYFPRCTFCPVVDGKYVIDYPTLANYEKLGINKPMLVGSNKYEGNFLMKSMAMTDEQSLPLAMAAFHRLPEEKAAEMVGKYKLPAKQGIADVLTDVMYTFPKIRIAEKAGKAADVFVYRYDYATPVMNLMGFKACHISEMLPLFNINLPPYDALRKMGEKTLAQIGKRMRKYWGAFARFGTPKVDGQIEWKAYNIKNGDSIERNTMVIDKNDHLEQNPESYCMDKFEGLERVVV